VTLRFEVNPYVRVGNLIFGSLPPDVARNNGPPSRTVKNYLGEMEEERQLFKARYDKADGTLNEVTFMPEACVIFDGLEINDEHKTTLGVLSKKDPDVCESMGFLIFPKLGIALAGFHDENDSGGYITIFKIGKWDAAIGRSKKYHI